VPVKKAIRLTGVSVQLNHTIVSCRDQQRSAAFLAGILGLPAATRFGHFLVVEADNGVSLDFAETTKTITPQPAADRLLPKAGPRGMDGPGCGLRRAGSAQQYPHLLRQGQLNGCDLSRTSKARARAGRA